MLSMINPDQLSRFESQAKFSTSNMHAGAATTHETYYEQQQHHHRIESSEKKGGKSSLLNFPGTKTSTNFYPGGPLGQVDEHRAGLNTAGGARLRPTSASVKKQIPVNKLT